jgi:hypothetical protein
LDIGSTILPAVRASSVLAPPGLSDDQAVDLGRPVLALSAPADAGRAQAHVVEMRAWMWIVAAIVAYLAFAILIAKCCGLNDSREDR